MEVTTGQHHTLPWQRSEMLSLMDEGSDEALNTLCRVSANRGTYVCSLPSSGYLQTADALPRLCKGLRRSLITTTSDSATVIPPPVIGCRILNASPIKSAPGVGSGAAGMVLFAIVLMLFCFSTAEIKAVYSSGGICMERQNCKARFPKMMKERQQLKWAISPPETEGASKAKQNNESKYLGRDAAFSRNFCTKRPLWKVLPATWD
ncbi:hypothetical protein QQP08_007646 [Theobroma cacao]|nr:hypothetical protein QQP08_007646 [Theobroma cacao]